jgi:periplasmic protein TonB
LDDEALASAFLPHGEATHLDLSTLEIEARNIRKAANSSDVIVRVRGCNIHVAENRNFNRHLLTRHRWNIDMDRDSKRELTRGSTLAVIVIVHGLIIFALVTHMTTVPSRNLHESILVTMIDKPRRLPVDLRLPTLKLNPTMPVLSPEVMPHVAVPVYAEPSSSLQDMDSKQTALNDSGVASNTMGSASKASGSGANVHGGGLNSIPVIYSVPPTYPQISVSAREQGYVIVQVLVDERGHANKVEVVRSSGFRRLDQSTLTAIRQWKFVPTNGSDGPEARTLIQWTFELSPPNLTIPIAVMPFDPGMARQIQLAATPKNGTDVLTSPRAGALDVLIKKIQSFELSIGSNRGPIPPIRLLALWGAVSSIQFMGNPSHGLDIKFEKDIDNKNKNGFHWEHYEVKQQHGVSEWLIAVSPDGAIKKAQAMICAPAQDVANNCPWP